MRLVAQIERDRLLVAPYEEHQAFYRERTEDGRYELGRLDERLGADHDTVDPHVQALRDALVAEHSERIDEVQG